MIDNFPEQEFPIYTNNLDVKLNRRNIEKDFSIFKITTPNKAYRTNVLDLPAEKFKARSVFYDYGNQWFIMFKKDAVSLNDLREEICKLDKDSIVKLVNFEDLDFKSSESVLDNELAQLIVNSLSNGHSDFFEYNNITGQLYYNPENFTNTETFILLQLRFYLPNKENHSKMALEAKGVTFSDYKKLKDLNIKNIGPNFVMDNKTAQLRKRIHDDYGSNAVFFDNKALRKEGRHITSFLNLDNDYNNFLRSKCGMISTFVADVRNKLSTYITIDQISIFKYQNHEQQSMDYENKDYESFLSHYGVCLVNEAEDTVVQSSSKIELIKRELSKPPYNVSEFSNIREPGKLIIEMIHEKDSDYYATREDLKSPNLFPEFNKPQDQHNLYTADEVIQHVTVENFNIQDSGQEELSLKQIETIEFANSSMIKNLIQELMIKQDLHDKRINTVKWDETKTWNFVICGAGKDRRKDNKKIYDYNFYKISIATDGTFTIDTKNSNDFPEDEEWEAIFAIFQQYNHSKFSNVECVIYNEINNINVIYKTKQFTLPDINHLSEKLLLANSQNYIDKKLLRSAIDEFRKLYPVSDSLETAFSIMNKNMDATLDETIKNYDLRVYYKNDKKLSIKPITLRPFINYFYEKTAELGEPILLHAEQKTKENKKKFFNSLIGVKSTMLDGTFKYFVGKKENGIKQSIATSCIIRDVIPWNQNGINPNGEILFNDFCHMLTVEFVRNGQYTVTPFPVKYLKEYIRFAEKDAEFDEDI